eukprot:712110-Pyramimonas_sp.AAC.1
MIALAASRLPVSIAHKNGEIDWVPTWMLSIHAVRLPRGAQPMAFRSFLALFSLMAFMTMVEPSVITR